LKWEADGPLRSKWKIAVGFVKCKVSGISKHPATPIYILLDFTELTCKFKISKIIENI
jgi:hypothetical protein